MNRFAWAALFLVVACRIGPPLVSAQLRTEFRALWVDTFNTALNNHADVAKVVNDAQAARANVILAQVRRRGDAWYLSSLEPPPDFVPIERGFDPLDDLIATAHRSGIQVHAFVIMAAVWNKDPAAPASAAAGPPTNPRHVFNLHGGYDPATKTIAAGPDTWLTRTLLPDGPGISYQGHRIGNDFWLDFGHPAAATYTRDAIIHLVTHYDLDGLHFDRIRFPELTVAGQSPATGANVGYNAVSIARFQRHHHLPDGSPPPSPAEERWAQWRRDQVTNLVRRVYLDAIAIRPRLTVSAALIAFGAGPTTEDAWTRTDAYWRVYQDWRAWLEEGILDVAMPMDYKRERDAAQALNFDQWTAWLRTHTYNRAGLVGIGAFLNAPEGTLRQTRRALTGTSGVAFYSMASSSEPRQPFAELASALTRGESADGGTRYEAAWPPVFAEAALIPMLPWKVAPRTGHIAGMVPARDGAAADAVAVRLVDADDREVAATATDGGGFFGFVDVRPGTYIVRVERDDELAGRALVTAGRVAQVTWQSAARVRRGTRRTQK